MIMAKRTNVAVLMLAVLGLLTAGCGSDPSDPQPGRGGSGGTGPITRPGGSGGDGGGGGEAGAGGEGGSTGKTVSLNSVRPPRGVQAGGQAVVLKGKGFLDQPGRPDASSTKIYFGSNPAIGVRIIDDTTINLTTPPGTHGDVDVVIENALGESTCAGCFQYQAPVEIHSVEPSEGPIHGGSQVILRGQGLRAGMVVTFGERAALDVTLEEDGSLSAILPPASREGAVDIRAFDANGQNWLRKGFHYVGKLSIDEISPPGGPLAGGNRVEIRGSGFTTSTKVYVDGVAAPAAWESAGMVSVTVPASTTPGPVEIRVEGSTSSASASYAYFDPADTTTRLYAISPQRGPIAGGTEVTLVGTGLNHGLLAVRFGGNLALPASALNGNIVKVTAPSGASALPVDVEARVSDGIDVLTAAYRYVASSRIDSISPSSGPASGGTTVSVSGANFPENARLFVGALEATNVNRVSSSLIVGVTPRGTVGNVPVRVVSPDGELEAVFAAGFTYEGTIALQVIEPSVAARAGGARITLRGSGFYDGMPVSFGANASAEVEVLDPFTAIAVTPRGNSGIVDVTAGPTDGVHATLPLAFTYIDPSSSSGGASGGPLNGTLNVTVLDGTQQKFGTPLENARVVVGNDDGTELQGYTDVRGQVSISSPLLVKPVTVTVSLAKYESATVVKQPSENLTFLLEGGEPGKGPPPPPGPIGTISGRVWGFKKPANRVLQPSEREIARVYTSLDHVFRAPPFGQPQQFQTITAEGGGYGFAFGYSANLAVYAVYGILNESTAVFEPLLMGVSRGIQIELEKDLTADIVLDTRLDMNVPVTLSNTPNITEVYAYIDMGPDGVIPVGSVTTTGSQTILQRLPALAGESFLFLARGSIMQGYYPLTSSFRRQAGDLREGLTIGPMMGLISVVAPVGVFDGTIEWQVGPGPAAEVAFVSIDDGNPFGPTPLWHIVLPGTERRVSLPRSVVQDLRASFPPGTQLRLLISLGREPRFSFDQWTYADIYLSSFTSYSSTGVYIRL